MTIGTVKFRTEAGARPWRELTDARQRAFRKLVEFLDAATPRTQTNFAQVDPWAPRESRVLFVSGRRGAGKTTLLLSVKKSFEEVRSCLPMSTRGDVSASDSVKKSFEEVQSRPLGTIGDDVLTLLEKCARKIIWLETLDLDPMPPSVNLLAAVLSRVEAKLKRDDGDRRSRRSIVEPEDDRDQTLNELQELRRQVAKAWEGNIPQRAAHVDPSTYAVEVGEVEDARIDLNVRLQQVLAKVAKHVPDQIGGSVFVLPVDDFDLNPLRSVELLRLVRALNVPNLLLIFLGDADLAEEMLYYEMCGKVAQISHNAASRDRSRLESRVSELASSIMRKLLPPAQRVYLEDLRRDERMGVGLEALKSQGSIPELDSQSFWDWLHPQHMFDSDDSVMPCCYQGSEILDASPRQLIDFTALLTHSGMNPCNLDVLISGMKRAFDMELREDPAVSFEIAREVDHAFIPRAAERVPVMDASRFERRIRVAEPTTFRVSSVQELRVSAVLREDLLIRDKRAPIEIGRRSTAHLMVLHDLLAKSSSGNIVGRFHRRRTARLSYARWFLTRDSKPLDVPWRLPFQHSFRQFQDFCRGWEIGAGRCREVLVGSSTLTESGLAPWLPWWWICAGLLAFPMNVTNRERQHSKLTSAAQSDPGSLRTQTADGSDVHMERLEAYWSPPDGTSPTTKTDHGPKWPRVVGGIVAVSEWVNKMRDAHADSAEVTHVENWLVDLMLLATPEAGAESWREVLHSSLADSDSLGRCVDRLVSRFYRARVNRLRRSCFRHDSSLVEESVARWVGKDFRHLPKHASALFVGATTPLLAHDRNIFRKTP